MHIKYGDIKHPDHAICLPSTTLKYSAEQVSNLEKGDLSNTDGTANWFIAYQASAENTAHTKDGAMNKLSTRREWSSDFTHGESQFGPKLINSLNLGGEASGSKAAGILLGALGGSALMRIYLPRTGISLVLDCASDAELLAATMAMENQQYALCRNNPGVNIYSIEEAARLENVIDIALEHVVSTSLKVSSNAELKEHIKLQDYPIIVNALIHLARITGYDMKQPCTANPSKCKHVATGVVDVSKMVWFDNASLNDLQRSILSAGKGQTDAKRLADYTAEFNAREENTHRVVKDGFETTFYFKNPTLAETFSDADEYISSLASIFERSITRDRDTRESGMYSAFTSQVCARYSHWVEKIVITQLGDDIEDGKATQIVDRESITSNLAAISNAPDPDIAEKLLEAIENYIASTSVSVVGIADYKCPSCGETTFGDDEDSTGIIPVPMLSLFEIAITEKRAIQQLAQDAR